MLKPKQHLIIAVIAFVLLLLFGFINKPEVKDSIRWAERPLVWGDFPIIDFIIDDYEAQVYSAIYKEGSIKAEDLIVFAAMDPNFSGRIVQDTTAVGIEQLLIHEQYHFNISEYCARLLRKEAVAIGKDKLTKSTLDRLINKYTLKIEALQEAYDTEANHNLEQEKQRYWELKIDDLLRETAYYGDENLFNYQQFTSNPTSWYRNINLSYKADLLTSYPESAAHSLFGAVYKVEKSGDSTRISFYENGKPKQDSFFDAAQVVYITKDLLTEIHLYNTDGSYDTDEAYSIKKYKSFPNGDMELTYHDTTGKQVYDDGIFKITRVWDPEKDTFFSSYWDEHGKKVPKSDGPYYELRTLDSLNRTTEIRYFDRNKNPVLDDDFIAVYAYELNDQNKIIEYRTYDTNEAFAYHTGEYHCAFTYDERGELIRRENLDAQGEKNTNNDGVCAYAYAYDNRGNLTDSRKFNDKEIPVLGKDDYHHVVSVYDAKDRLLFDAQYYPDYVLKFTDEMWGATKYAYENDSVRVVKNLDVFNDPINNEQGISVIKQSLNDKKLIVFEAYFDSNGGWAKTSDSINIYKYKYDEDGFEIESASFDSLQRPLAHTADVAITRWEYDTNGNKIKTTYYNEAGNLAAALQNVTYNNYTYDTNNFLLERTNYDRNMNPQELDGVFKTKILPNRFGKDSIVMYYTKNNSLIAGVCKTLYTYNTYGNLVSERYFNKQNQPERNDARVHKILYTYSKTQIYTGYENYGTSGQKINDNTGVWSEQRKLTPAGFIKTRSYYNIHNKPVLGVNGHHQLEYYWNKAQETIRVSTYGTDKKLLKDAYGVADYVYKKEASSLATRISYYDENQNLTENEDGVAEYFYTPSLNGLYYLEKQLDKNGNEVIEEELEEEMEETLEETL